jgi:hypothetical protein
MDTGYRRLSIVGNVVEFGCAKNHLTSKRHSDGPIESDYCGRQNGRNGG